MRYIVEIKLKNGKEIKWLNGGVGYDEHEMPRVTKKLQSDSRVASYRVKTREEGKGERK